MSTSVRMDQFSNWIQLQTMFERIILFQDRQSHQFNHRLSPDRGEEQQGTIRQLDHADLRKSRAELVGVVSQADFALTPCQRPSETNDNKKPTPQTGNGFPDVAGRSSEAVHQLFSFTRRKSVSRRRSLPCNNQKVPDSWLRVYQEELKKERKRQQAMLAKKNAERTLRRTHFRSHHCLPRQTPAARKPAPTKDDSFFGAFQGLSLDGITGAARLPACSAGGEPCKVM